MKDFVSIYVARIIASNYYHFKFNALDFNKDYCYPEYIHLFVKYFDDVDFDWNICL